MMLDSQLMYATCSMTCFYIAVLTSGDVSLLFNLGITCIGFGFFRSCSHNDTSIVNASETKLKCWIGYRQVCVSLHRYDITLLYRLSDNLRFTGPTTTRIPHNLIRTSSLITACATLNGEEKEAGRLTRWLLPSSAPKKIK